MPDGDTMRERPTIVFVHGGPGFDHSMFKAFYAQLTDIAQLVYYDHRGNGRSEDGPKERWTLDQWSDDLRALCETLGIERPIVFGTSFGGFVALNYAARHPEHPGKLIVSSTTSKIHLDRSMEMFERLGGPEVRAVPSGTSRSRRRKTATTISASSCRFTRGARFRPSWSRA